MSATPNSKDFAEHEGLHLIREYHMVYLARLNLDQAYSNTAREQLVTGKSSNASSASTTSVVSEAASSSPAAQASGM